jgi:hypothetical protein
MDDATEVRGLLLQNVQAGTFERPTWVDVPLGSTGITLTTASDELRVDVGDGLLRIGTTWREAPLLTRALSDLLGEEIIPPSQQIVDAIYKAARIKTVLHGQGTVAMMSYGMAKKFNADVDQQISNAVAKGSPATLIAGAGKTWILHARLDHKINDAILAALNLPSPGPNPAVNYGGFDVNEHPIQTVGGRHNWDHIDETQLYRPLKRWARAADGSQVDLLAWIEQHEHVSSVYTDPFRAPASASAAVAGVA